MNKDNKRIGWLHSIGLSMTQEFKHIFRDEAVIIFFVVLAIVYPPLYSLIYNPEVVRDEAVVVVDDLKGMKALDYATALANKWGVGHKETNDGITILVKPKTGDTPQGKGQAAIAVGTGMEKILTSDLCQRIIDEEMIPKFKQNNYGEAIEEALDKIKDILTGDKD